MPGAGVGMFSAMVAAIKLAILLYAVANDFAITVDTYRSQGMDRTLKRVERMFAAIHRHSKCLIIFVSTNFTAWHG
jgi:hypothetical protein